MTSVFALLGILQEQGRLAPTALQLVPAAELLVTLPAVAAEPPSWAEQHGNHYRAPLHSQAHPATTLIIHGPANQVTAEVTLAYLRQMYSASHPLLLIDAADLSELPCTPGELRPIDDERQRLLIVPALAALEDVRSLRGLRTVVERLHAPGGCPWDVAQDHRSLRSALLEEAYEVLEALDSGDMAALRDELGDLLIAVMTHSEMARQAGYFTLDDVFAAVTRRLVGRHPHVFGTLQGTDVGQVLHNWEAIKAEELRSAGRMRHDPLDGVPPALPALATAQKLLKKAKRTGFDWPDHPARWAKLEEELAELRSAASAVERQHELGDVLMVLADLALADGLDAETALRETTQRFRQRFSLMQSYLAEGAAPDHATAWRTAVDRLTRQRDGQ